MGAEGEKVVGPQLIWIFGVDVIGMLMMLMEFER
jgi:hypothetical protein